MMIRKEDTLAVIIDIQEKLLPHIYQWEETLHNCMKLIEGLQILSVPLVVTQQCTKGLGATNASIINKISPFSYIEKTSFSCYGEPVFQESPNAIVQKNIAFKIFSYVLIFTT